MAVSWARGYLHANIEKTAIYTHTEDDELIEAVGKLD